MRRFLHSHGLAIILFALVLPMGLQRGAAEDLPEGAAAESAGAAQGAVPPLTRPTVESALAELDASTTIDDVTKEAIRAKYQQALEALQQAAEFTAQAEQYEAAAQSASSETEAARRQLQALASADDVVAPDPTSSTQELQEALAARRVTHQDLAEELERVTAELAAIKTRPTEISERLPEVQHELAAIEEQWGALPDDGPNTSPSREADRFVLQATHAQLLAELEMLKQEQLSQSQRETLLSARQQLLQQRTANASAAVDALKALLDKQLTAEARRASARVAAIVAEIPSENEKANRLGRYVQSLAEEFERVVSQVKQVRAFQSRLASEKEALVDRYDVLREQLQLGGGGVGMTQSLIDFQRQLLDAGSDTAAAGLPELDETRLALLNVEEGLREQAAVEQEFTEEDLADEAASPVAQLVALRRELLGDLRDQYGVLIRGLAELYSDQRLFDDRMYEMAADIKDQLFWMRTCRPISLETITDLPDGLAWVLSFQHGRALGEALLHAPRQRPLVSLLFLLPALGLLLARGAISQRLRQRAEHVRRISTDRYGHTLMAALWTLMLALPIPLLLWFGVFALRNAPQPTQWTWDLAGGLETGAWLTFGGTLLAAACRPAGLGAGHFGWKNTALVPVRRTILLYLVVSVPMLVLAASTFHEDQAYYFNSLGRLALIGSVLWAAWLAWRLFYHSEDFVEGLRHEHSGQLITKWRSAWSALIVATPLAIVALAVLGYVMTAMALNTGLLVTVGIVAAGRLFFELVLRWFKVKQRKLALAEALERRREREAAAAEGHDDTSTSEVVNVEPEEEAKRSLAEISDDTQRLLGLLFGAAIVASTALYWSRTLPIWDYLDRVPVLPAANLTWQQLIELGLIVVVTIVVVRDAPGVIELGVLRATRIAPGTRKAITTLCQYGLTAIGAAFFFSILNVDWAQLGWIAAALSVGLGFGLQEVVGNFVCGLILLFERPLRVGDIVTVEGITGTVSKIHLRATTIVNWDRQEFVVPNKTLITSTLLNWTLSAPINRIVVPIGVAYGSDTTRARDILLDVAKDHPLILDDPAPMATFEQFADSSLTLYLRAYLPDMENRLAAITDLHTAIDERFKQAGIEIAFPQQDLHLRTGWENLHQPGEDAAT